MRYTVHEDPDLDLGHGHTLRWTSFTPDRGLNPQYADVPDVEKYGALVGHARGDGTRCEGFVTFDSEISRRIAPDRAKWTVESWEPLTITPSLACHCGDHGWIRDGRWIPA